MMHFLREDRVSLVSILLAGLLSFLSFDSLPLSIPIRWGIDGSIIDYTYKRWGVYRYPEFMLLIYFFFRLTPRIDKGRISQLKNAGFYDPLRHGAVLLFGFNHMLSLGTGLGWISLEANYLIGASSFLIILAGIYGRVQLTVLDRIINFLGTESNGHTRIRFSLGLIIAGLLGLLGVSIGHLQIVWLIVPLVVHLIQFRIRYRRIEPGL